MGVSLRTLLLVPFVLQVLGMTSLVGYLSYRAGQQAVEEMAEQLIVETGERVNQKLDIFFEDADHIIVGNQLAVELETLDWQNPTLVEQYFVKQMRVHPSIGALGMATGGQDLLVVMKTTPDRLAIVRGNAATGEFNSNIADPQGNVLYRQNIPENAVSLTRVGQLWGEVLNAPRSGVWRPIVSSLTGPEQTAIIMARVEPFRDAGGQEQGVFGVGFFLDQVGDILKSLDMGAEGQVFVMDNEGWLIATSEAEAPLGQNLDAELQPGQILVPDQGRLQARDSQSPVTPTAAQWAEGLGPSSSSGNPELAYFRVKGERYFGYRLPLTLPNQPDWTVVMAIPTAEFQAAIAASNQRTLLLCSLGLISSVFVGSWILRVIAHPLEQLNQTIQTYAAEGGLPQRSVSGVRDLDALGQTLEQMVVRLEAQKRHVAELHANYAQRLQAQVEDKTRKLQATSATLRQALALSSAVVWEHDLPSQEVFFSSTTGDSETQAMGYEEAMALVHPDDQSRVRQANVEAIATRGSYDLEHRVVAPDHPSGWRWLQVNARVITDAAHRPIKILGMSVDISDRKRAELALRESEAHFATIFRDNPAPAWIAQLKDGLVLDVNRSFCVFLGGEAQDVMGHTCTDLGLWDHPEDCERLRQILTQHGMHRNYQTTWRTRGGESRTVLLSTKVVTFQGEACVIGVVNDITDRQETETMLRQLSQQLLTWRDRYEVAIWAGRQIIYEYDALTDCYTWGRNTQDVLGYDLEEMPQTLEEYVGFIHPTEQQIFLDLMTGGVDVSEPFQLEFRMLHQESGYIWLEDQGVPHLDDQGRLVKVVGALKDISDRKRSEAERAHIIALLKQSEANYLGILQHQTELVTRFTADGILLFVNQAFCTYYGVTWEEVVGQKYYANIYPEDQPAIEQCLAALSFDHPVGTVQHRAIVKGEIRWMEWTNKAIYDAEGNFVELQSVGRDIHDRRQTELALKESQAKFQRLVDDIGDKFVVFSRTGETGIVTYVSDGVETVFGLRKVEIVGQPWHTVIAWDADIVTPRVMLEDPEPDQPLDFYQFERGFTHPNGEHRIVTISQHQVKDPLGQLVAIEGIVEDITDRKHSEQELKALNIRLQTLNFRLEELATQDSLTRLANRRKMEQVLLQEWHRCQREDKPLALILLDIDFFKPYNDHYGHPQGDWCLQQVAQILQDCIKRPGDLAARYGGEEFLLILPNTDTEGALAVARHIQSSLASLAIPHADSAVRDHVTVSLGIAVAITINPDLSCSEAVALADKALYQAKQIRNTYHIEVMG